MIRKALFGVALFVGKKLLTKVAREAAAKAANKAAGRIFK